MVHGSAVCVVQVHAEVVYVRARLINKRPHHVVETGKPLQLFLWKRRGRPADQVGGPRVVCVDAVRDGDVKLNHFGPGGVALLDLDVGLVHYLTNHPCCPRVPTMFEVQRPELGGG